ncbi:PREDICTED: N-acetylneuraminate lyase-like [Eufriesea mexicana]|uniref:N-acetylneuraminate lyase-like n=1 Tax=Eufriesea mexicana TaxID=516756 RepID=UPI00083BFA75|nr:PREDICTED: N-acetylneuraminate lyase-like [Eufriesea mexicana]
MPKVSFTFRGLIAPVLTPFNNDSTRTLNLSMIPQYADLLVKRKVTGVLVNGTSGEGPSMSVSERKLVAEAWATATRTTKQHLMVQVGGASLPDVLELARHAESIKADSILCLPELYFSPTTTEQLTDYLRLVSLAAPNTPLLYYHIPSFTHVNIHMGQWLESQNDHIPTLVGIKFTSPNMEEGAQALRACGSKYVVFLGNDQLVSAGTALGMDSFIITSLNMLPELVLETVTEGLVMRNVMRARDNQQRLTSAVMAISRHGTWVETMKVAMSLLTNMNLGPPRAPLCPLPTQAVTSMAKELQGLGFDIRM